MLKPAYIDPDTSYRYYDYDQIYLVELIQICIQLDIQLSELKKYMTGDIIDYSALLSFGEKIAKQKLSAVERSLRFIVSVQERIEQADEHSQGEIYIRQIHEKYFLVKPVSGFDDDVFGELLKSNHTPYNPVGELLEYGLFAEITADGIKRYAFTEIAEKPNKLDNIRVIPSGEYYCKVTPKSEIENAKNTFSSVLQNTAAFLVIETAMFTSKYKIDKPFQEVRVIRL
ncbi:hypothetical protein J45TS6_32020 [Paenibacillus sp. J45TS6]|uniref:hypothetical protein n=1 Tax=Paenibacillus sp. J45TS6 TaxID=2807196 RepID=UPI001B0B8300|nr:hypothetical protein [Paenibacillus sp. J45TS6]GIP44743.1 hypothetical protein J45TS6_32020 [Paenibacillus sp. J45TS6]